MITTSNYIIWEMQKTVIRIPKHRVDHFFSIWHPLPAKKKLCFDKKKANKQTNTHTHTDQDAKNLKIEFQQRVLKLKNSINK